MYQLNSLIKYFFFEQLSMSYICEIWFPSGEQSKVFKRNICIVSVRNTLLYLLSIMLNWSIEGNLTLLLELEGDKPANPVNSESEFFVTHIVHFLICNMLIIECCQ